MIAVFFWAFPSRLGTIYISSGWQIVVMGAIALALGSTLLVINRYLIHQFIDWLLYVLGADGPASNGKCSYLDALADHVVASHKIMNAGNHVMYRTSNILFLYCVVEVLIVFGTVNDPNSPIAKYRFQMFFGAGLLSAAAIWQTIIVRRIDSRRIRAGDTQQMVQTNKQTSRKLIGK